MYLNSEDRKKNVRRSGWEAFWEGVSDLLNSVGDAVSSIDFGDSGGDGGCDGGDCGGGE